MNSFGILSSLHAIESAERTQGPQETKNNTGRTSKPQEAKNNNTERTSAPQETKNNTGRTSGPQEKAEKTQGLQVGNIRFGNSTVSEEEVGQVTSFLGGHFSPLGLVKPPRLVPSSRPWEAIGSSRFVNSFHLPESLPRLRSGGQRHSLQQNHQALTRQRAGNSTATSVEKIFGKCWRSRLQTL